MTKSPDSRLVFWNPFSSTSFLHGGRDGLLVIVSTNIVLKLPWRFEEDTYGTKYRKVKNSLKHFKSEKAMYEIINARPHPNILQSFLSTADGIFLPRMLESLDNRLKQQGKRPISEQEKYSWIVQISSAAAWLEHLDYFHGDLRPPNILLDAAGDVKICDFANMTRRGGKNPGATAPFYISDTAGLASEQFAIGSCIFAIFKGHELLSAV
jgi:serine/threonine protein kinase